MRTKIGLGGLIAAVAMMAAEDARAQGYQVQPMLATIRPSGTDASVRLTLKNTGAVPITLELEPFRATVDDAGIPTRTPEDKDLLVFPPQTIVPPGREQAVQVRYVGDAALTDARMYGVRVNQLPVDFQKGTMGSDGAQTDVKVSFTFLSHLLVSPPGATAAVEVSSIERTPDGGARLTMRNSGSAIAVVNNATWKVTDMGGKTVELTSEQVHTGDFSAFMPKQQRLGTIEPKALAGLNGNLRATIQVP